MKNKISVTGLLAVCLVTFSANGYSAMRPNILLFSMDDLKPELSCYGSKMVKTPNMDELANSGMLFSHHYVQQAICGPSRASMLCGLRPDTTKVWDLQHTCREECPTAFSMQEYFKNAGYETAGGGKIVHGFKDYDPLSWSIPYVHSETLPYADGKVPALYARYQGKAVHAAYEKLKESGLKSYGENQRFMCNLNAKPSTECLEQPDDAYHDGALTVWGMDMLEQFSSAEKPFFLTLGYRKPHLPFVAPKKYWDLFDRDKIDLAEFREMPEGAPDFAYHSGSELGGYTDIEIDELKDELEKQRELIHGYYACVAYVDAQIGKMMAKLKETGLDKNTIVVLWGDHGWHLGDHNIWCKHSTYEQATRSPLLIFAPDFPAGGKTESMVESVDIFPTLCELAGLPVPRQLEGKSLVPILKDPSEKVKEFSMSQYPDHGGKKLMGYSLRTERYRLVLWMPNEVSRTGEFDRSLVVATELYDYQLDPLETVNQVGNPKYIQVLQDLEANFKLYFRPGS